MSPTPRRIAVYLSGHGFGHLAQIAPLLFELDHLRPGIEILLRCDLPPELLGLTLQGLNLTILPGPVDVGVVQRSAVEEDWAATRTAVEAFFRPWESRIADEVARLAPLRPEAIVSNISPLAFPVARLLGIPSLALASLDWAAIYGPVWGQDDPWVNLIATAHRDCTLRLSPPLSIQAVGFSRTESIPLLVRTPRSTRRKVRAALGWGEHERVALILFGGTGQPAFDLHGLDSVAGWRFALPGPLSAPLPANVEAIAIDRPFATPDLLAAADAVVTKPGYGVLAEAWQGECPVVYLSRTGFPEYPVLHDWLRDHAPSALLDLDSFRSGHWGHALEQAAASPYLYPPSDGWGGRIAAERVLALKA